jgi:hypothetical protein
MSKYNNINKLTSKYGSKIILLTIFVDELTPKEYKDLEYLEERIQTHIEIQTKYYKV